MEPRHVPTRAQMRPSTPRTACGYSRTTADRRSLRHRGNRAQVLMPACGGAASQTPHSPPQSSTTDSSSHGALRRRSPQRMTISGSAWRGCWSRTTSRSALSRCRAGTFSQAWSHHAGDPHELTHRERGRPGARSIGICHRQHRRPMDTRRVGPGRPAWPRTARCRRAERIAAH